MATSVAASAGAGEPGTAGGAAAGVDVPEDPGEAARACLEGGRRRLELLETDDGEVVVNRGTAEDGDLRLGDTTTLLTPEPVTVTVVGIAIALVVGIPFHEFSHAAIADSLGDHRPRALHRVRPLRRALPLQCHPRFQR